MVRSIDSPPVERRRVSGDCHGSRRRWGCLQEWDARGVKKHRTAAIWPIRRPTAIQSKTTTSRAYPFFSAGPFCWPSSAPLTYRAFGRRTGRRNGKRDNSRLLAADRPVLRREPRKVSLPENEQKRGWFGSEVDRPETPPSSVMLRSRGRDGEAQTLVFRGASLMQNWAARGATMDLLMKGDGGGTVMHDVCEVVATVPYT